MLPSILTLALLSQPYRTPITLACDGGIVCTKSGTTYTVIGTGTGGGGGADGGAPVDGEYVTYAANGTLTAERVLSAGNYTVVDNGTAGQSQIDWQHGLTCAPGNVLTTNGTDQMICVNPVPDAAAFVTGGIRLTGDLSGTATSPVVVDDSHAHTGTTISSLDTGDLTSGTLGVGRGGTGVSTVSSNQVYVGTAADTFTAKTLPSCSNATTSKLLYDNSTQTFSCGTDQTGGGGGGVSPLFVAQGSP